MHGGTCAPRLSQRQYHGYVHFGHDKGIQYGYVTERSRLGYGDLEAPAQPLARGRQAEGTERRLSGETKLLIPDARH